MYLWQSVEIKDDSLVRVSVQGKMMILREVLRYGVEFNRPLIHSVQQTKGDDETHWQGYPVHPTAADHLALRDFVWILIVR